jgi:hypothetical protein
MQRLAPIANETEFQEWLASVLESERQRLREKAAEREFLRRTSFEAARKNRTKETLHHENER